MRTKPINFGYVVTAVGAPGTPDSLAYRNLVGDCEQVAEFGFETIWLIEHHFSDYFPTPNPLAMLSHLTARFPTLGLGTCVLVTPWHNALRLAEDIAQLASLTDAPLHLGMGRGTALAEYDAFSIDMDEAQQRFREIWDVIRLGLSGEPFTYGGTFIKAPKEVVLRPKLEKERRETIHFYGAIGSPGTAERMADMGLPPMCTSIGNYEAQCETLRSWQSRADQNGLDGDFRFPIMINCIIEDTTEEAIEAAKTYIPPFMQAQVDHYEAGKDNWQHLQTYKAWSRIFAGMQDRAKPENIPPWCEWQLVGDPELVAWKLQAFIDAGFDTFLIHTATPGVPEEPRRRWAKRFSQEIMPRFAGEQAIGTASLSGTPASQNRPGAAMPVS
jgi:alkanesulfonate monooxygenase SsuD/methylene tetrahydromethanopterin reductase-like flavin-dependent oxidoreductase (luciferase family)